MERGIQKKRVLGETQKKHNSDMNGSLLDLKESMFTNVCAYVNLSASIKKLTQKLINYTDVRATLLSTY